MTKKRFAWRRSSALCAVLAPLLVCAPALAGTIDTLYSFKGPDDDEFIVAGMVADASGNLYGTTTTQSGSPDCTGHCGTVFMLSPPAKLGRSWVEKTLHSFSGRDGNYMSAGGLLLNNGNLYGTASYGGAGNFGVVFELSPPPPGEKKWTYRILHAFKGGHDGANPSAGVVMDAAGDLFGAAFVGGKRNLGTVFELSPPAAGQTKWTEQTLYSFAGRADGSYPYGGLVLDGNGNLYGTTRAGGGSDACNDEFSPGPGCGTVFMLSPPSGARTGWTETILHAFASGDDGRTPIASLILDESGDLIGTTQLGGNGAAPCNGAYGPGCGVVFKLEPPAAGASSWTESVLHTFTYGIDGAFPNSALIPAGASGGFYGTVPWGGPGGYGTAYTMSAGGDVTLLNAFASDAGGYTPFAGLSQDAAGTLYGTTFQGAPDSFGTVYSIVP